MVALDIETGSPVWEKKLAITGGDTLFHLAHGSDKLVVVTSSQAKGKKYYIYVHDAQTGERAWNTELKWRGEGHGAHLKQVAKCRKRIRVVRKKGIPRNVPNAAER